MLSSRCLSIRLRLHAEVFVVRVICHALYYDRMSRERVEYTDLKGLDVRGQPQGSHLAV